MTGYDANLVAIADARFGGRLRGLREWQGMSQQTLVEKLAELGITTWHQTTVGKVEAGKRPVRLAEAIAVAKIFGTSIDVLLMHDDDEYRAQRVQVLEARRQEVVLMQTLLEQREEELGQWIELVETGRELPGDMPPEWPSYLMDEDGRVVAEFGAAVVETPGEGGEAGDQDADADPDAPAGQHREET
ncbi:helix-turn-helix transcriptional regulator [Pseudonocardia sp. NPDC049154]|uniref:helix-turn-helix domain-containing protein n=1 Tax=Pseudonocardia sp. NPDC049154 TaxID=3155501 RepID=UPI003408D54C